MWREGEWLDLWSVVHFFSGVSLGLGMAFVPFGPGASTLLALLLFVLCEMWEALVRIQETPANRCMDVVVGFFGFAVAYFFLTPQLGSRLHVLVFALVLAINFLLSVSGWRASQKAAALEERVRARYVRGRKRIAEKQARLRARFRRSPTSNSKKDRV